MGNRPHLPLRNSPHGTNRRPILAVVVVHGPLLQFTIHKVLPVLYEATGPGP
jgi:hypothetical protein